MESSDERAQCTGIEPRGRIGENQDFAAGNGSSGVLTTRLAISPLDAQQLHAIRTAVPYQLIGGVAGSIRSHDDIHEMSRIIQGEKILKLCEDALFFVVGRDDDRYAERQIRLRNDRAKPR